MVYQGELSHSDLVYKEGDESWKELSCFDEVDLRQAAGEIHGLVPPPEDTSNLKKEDYFLLTVDSDEENGAVEFRSQGCFRKKEIKKKLRTKEIKWTDYVWGAGYTRWTRIGQLSEFDRRKTRSNFLDRSYKVVTPVVLILLIAYVWRESLWVELNKKKNAYDQSHERESLPQLYVAELLRILNRNVEKVEKKEAPHASKQKIAKNSLEWNLRSEELARGNVGYILKGVKRQRVYVRVSGLSGQVLGAPGFEKSYEFNSSTGEKLISLFEKGVPPGRFRMTLRAGSVELKTRLFLGNKRQTEKKIKSYLKRHSHLIYSERQKVIRIHSEQLKALRRLAKSSSVSRSWLRKWESLRKEINSSLIDGRKSFFVEGWRSMSRYEKEVSSQVIMNRRKINKNNLFIVLRDMEKKIPEITLGSVWRNFSKI